jgi:DNA-binding NtrC family response regulator
MERRYTVLLVDDDPALTAALRRRFHAEPFRVLEAHSGADALEMMAREQVDVVVADEAMPGMAGSDLLARVAQLYPDTVNLMLTGQAGLETAIRAINAGRVFRFLTKPCEPDELLIAIRLALVERARTPSEDRDAARELTRLELQHPGIATVRRDEDGAVIIE